MLVGTQEEVKMRNKKKNLRERKKQRVLQMKSKC
jgi:hypothetical protein